MTILELNRFVVLSDKDTGKCKYLDIIVPKMLFMKWSAHAIHGMHHRGMECLYDRSFYFEPYLKMSLRQHLACMVSTPR